MQVGAARQGSGLRTHLALLLWLAEVEQGCHFSSWNQNQTDRLFGLPGSKWITPVNVSANYPPASCRQLGAASCHFNAKRQHEVDNKAEGGEAEGWLCQGQENACCRDRFKTVKTP